MATEIRTYPDEYLACGVFRHAWAVADLARASGGRIVLNIRCARCGCTKRETRTSDWKIVNRKYTYPPGYRMKARATTSEKAKEVVRRYFTTVSVKAS